MAGQPKTKTKEIGRLRMAEVVLDATLGVLVAKGVLTRKEVQEYILNQPNDPES